MGMAFVAAMRSTCARNIAVGAILTDIDLTTVLSMGYNGPPRKIETPCTITPQTAGSCTCLHAEENVLLKAPYDGRETVMFTTLAPCAACARRILNSTVKRVEYARPYRFDEGILLLKNHGVEVVIGRPPQGEMLFRAVGWDAMYNDPERC